MDATIIAARPSTKSQRDPERHQTHKGQQWYFGMKAHLGADDAHGLVHTVEGTVATTNPTSARRTAFCTERKSAPEPTLAIPA